MLRVVKVLRWPLRLMVLPQGIDLRGRGQGAGTVLKLERYLAWHHDWTLVLLRMCQDLLLTNPGESLLMVRDSLS